MDLTTIDAGALRGDLGDRLLIVDLDPIPDHRRREKRELRALFEQRRPALLGAVLDLLASVLAELPQVQLASMPRMADFARVLAAMDRVLGTDALGAYLAQRGRIAGDVVASDLVAEAVVAHVRETGEWSGTAQDLLLRITPQGKAPDRWPRSARALGGRLRRLAPALRLVGVEVVPPAKTDKSRRWVVRATAQTAQRPETALGAGPEPDPGWAVEVDQPPERDGNGPDSPGNSPDEDPSGDSAKSDSGRSGGPGGWMNEPSGTVPLADPDGEVIL